MTEPQINYIGLAIFGGAILYFFGLWVVLHSRCGNKNKEIELRDMTYSIFWPIFLIKVTIIALVRLVIDAIRALFTL